MNQHSNLSFFRFWIAPACLTIFFIALASCARITQGYKIDLILNSDFEDTEIVEVLTEMPGRDFVVIASFIGSEPAACKSEIEFCQLQKLGRELGADAAWIQKHTIYNEPDTWTLIEGKPTKIRGIKGNEYSGVFIKYKALE